MIRPTLETPQLTADQECRLVIRLSNVGPQVCRGLVFRVRLPPELVALRGKERIEVGELPPGALVELPLLVRPLLPGEFLLVSSNFQYRDSYDRVVVAPQWRHQVAVQPAPLSLEQQAAHDAERHARAQNWEAAWPLFLQARDRRQALRCLQRAVHRLRGQDQVAGVAAQYLAYARAVRQIGDPDLGSNPLVIQGLEQAMVRYAQSDQADLAEQCRDLRAYLARSPLLAVRIPVQPRAELMVGRAGSLVVEITNRGYGPARQVHLVLSGMLERSGEYDLPDLSVGETVTCAASVVPSHAGPCTVRLEAAAVPYGDGAPVTTTWQTVITGLPADLPDRPDQLHGINVHVEIGNYIAPGGIHVTNQDSVTINRTSPAGQSRQHPPARPSNLEDPGGRYCLACGVPVGPAQKFCTQCGAKLHATNV